MQKNLLLLAFLFLTACFKPCAVSASDPTLKITFGTEYELPKKHVSIGFIGNQQDGYIDVSHQYGKSMVLQKFSPSLKLTGEKTIDLKGMPKGYMIEDFIQWGNDTYWLFSTWDKPAQQEHLFVQKIDVVNGDLSGKAKELIQTDKLGGQLVATGFYKFQVADKYKVSFSTDSTKLFIYVNYREKSKDGEEYGFWVFDRNFDKIWNKRIKFPYPIKKVSVEDVQTDRAGDFLFLTKVYNDDTRKDIKDNAPNFHFEILKYNSQSDKPEKTPFEFSDRYVAQLNLEENVNGDIICCGFYGEKDKNGKLRAISGKVDGSFFLKYDPATGKIDKVHKGFYEIPDEIFKQNVGEKAVKKIEKKEAKGEGPSENNLVLRKVIFGDDGSILMLGEVHYIVTYTTYSNGHSYTHYEYFYNDIIAQYINPDGGLAWTKKIPKRQSGGTTFGLGFKVLPYKGNNYVMFLDNIKNLNLGPDQVPASHSAGWGGVLMSVKLDAQGGMKKFKLFDTREVKENVNILGADEIAPGVMLTRVFNKKKSKICLMEVTGG